MFDEFMVKIGFNINMFDSCVYYKWLSNEVGIFMFICVDDMLIASTNKVKI